jgi:hypothetical protein
MEDWVEFLLFFRFTFRNLQSTLHNRIRGGSDVMDHGQPREGGLLGFKVQR